MSDAARPRDLVMFDLVHDLDGLPWRIMLAQSLAPASQRADRLVWHVRLHAETRASAGQFVSTGTLHRIRDERLLGLLADQQVFIRCGEIKFEASDERQIPVSAAEAVRGIKKALSSKGVSDMKRRAIGARIDQACSFG